MEVRDVGGATALRDEGDPLDLETGLPEPWEHTSLCQVFSVSSLCSGVPSRVDVRCGFFRAVGVTFVFDPGLLSGADALGFGTAGIKRCEARWGATICSGSGDNEAVVWCCMLGLA